MRRVATLYRSSVGKKVLMAVTGFVLVGFVVGHMVGNLKAFQGREAFNAYAEGLRGFGYPFLPHGGGLWIVRIVLLAAVLVHIVAAFQLWRMSSRARHTRYRKWEELSFSYASRTMRWGGVILLLFVIYHILHFTTGTAHTSFVQGDPYHNLVAGFRNPLVAGVYLLAMAALALHLYHGVWSGFQTLGASHPKYNRFRRPLAGLLAGLVFVGFMLVPAAILAGFVS